MKRHCSVLLDHVALQLDREGLKGRQDSKTSAGWGALFEEGDYFKYFHQRVGIFRGILVKLLHALYGLVFATGVRALYALLLLNVSFVLW